MGWKRWCTFGSGISQPFGVYSKTFLIVLKRGSEKPKWVLKSLWWLKVSVYQHTRSSKIKKRAPRTSGRSSGRFSKDGGIFFWRCVNILDSFFFFSFFPFSCRSTVGWAERLAQVLCFDVFVYFGHYHDTNSDAAAPAIVAPRSSSLFLGCRNLKCLRVREALENFSLSLQTDVNRLSELCDWRYQHTLMYSVTVLHAGLFQT